MATPGIYAGKKLDLDLKYFFYIPLDLPDLVGARKKHKGDNNDHQPDYQL
jgi:hypothetical protein